MDQVTARGSDQKEWAKAPEGQHQGVLVDVIDLKMHPNVYMGVQKGMVHKCALVFQIDEINPDTGKRFELSRDFTVSMGEKANLRKFLGVWRGKSYTDQEAEEGAPLHKLEGVNALIQVEHKQSKSNPDRSYANIVSVTGIPKGLAKIAPKDYERSEHWAKKIGESDRPADVSFDDFPAALEDGDDDLPF
jgi:hypothetical protein